MAAVKVFRGDTWERAWILRRADGSALDLTGARARLHVRDATGALVVEASMGNGRITIDPAAGRIDMRVPADVMAAVSPGQYRFDVELTQADGTVRTLEQQTLNVIEDMTHD